MDSAGPSVWYHQTGLNTLDLLSSHVECWFTLVAPGLRVSPRSLINWWVWLLGHISMATWASVHHFVCRSSVTSHGLLLDPLFELHGTKLAKMFPCSEQWITKLKHITQFGRCTLYSSCRLSPCMRCFHISCSRHVTAVMKMFITLLCHVVVQQCFRKRRRNSPAWTHPGSMWSLLTLTTSGSSDLIFCEIYLRLSYLTGKI